MNKDNLKTVLFAKEKPGLNEIVELLRSYTSNLQVFTGHRTDPFPKEALTMVPDLTISYLSPWIIPAKLLRCTRKWALNFHPGPPEYPGTGCTNFALYNLEKIYGVTAHLMEPAVDTGRIISVKRFPVLADDTVYSLTERAYQSLCVLFREVISGVFENNQVSWSDEVWTRKPFLRKELDALCEITPLMDPKEIARRIRATWYPGMPGPYIKLAEYKFEYQETANV